LFNGEAATLITIFDWKLEESYKQCIVNSRRPTVMLKNLVTWTICNNLTLENLTMTKKYDNNLSEIIR
jgi:hypothetical protein